MESSNLHGNFSIDISDILNENNDKEPQEGEWYDEDLFLLSNILNMDVELTEIPSFPTTEAELPPSSATALASSSTPENDNETSMPKPKRFKTTDDAEIEDFFKERQSNATKKNTAWGMRIFQDWNQETVGTAMNMETVTVNQLADALKCFYVAARPKPKKNDNNNDGKPDVEHVYHRNTLLNIRGAINRHLADLHRKIDIVNDKEFKTANGVLDGLLKHRLRTGQSKPTNHKAIIEPDDLKKIGNYLSKAPYCPVTLRQHVWYNLSIHFVSRGMEFHHQLKTDSFKFISDESGEYVTMNFETQQKNYQGGLSSDQAPADKRMYATNTDSCPVKMLRLLLDKTEKTATHLFNKYSKQATITPSTCDVWYINSPLAKRTFSNFLADICKNAGVQKMYSPHCLRATAIQFLNDNGFEARHIMYMSSHKNEASLRSYNRNVSTSQKKALSSTLAALTNNTDTSGDNNINNMAASHSEHIEAPTKTQTDVVPFEMPKMAVGLFPTPSDVDPATRPQINIENTRHTSTANFTPGLFTCSSFQGCTFNFSK